MYGAGREKPCTRLPADKHFLGFNLTSTLTPPGKRPASRGSIISDGTIFHVPLMSSDNPAEYKSARSRRSRTEAFPCCSTTASHEAGCEASVVSQE